MPVSWHRRLLVSSATWMFLIMVPRIALPVELVSPRSRRLNPSLMSGGSILRARIYSSFAASSTCFRSTFTRRSVDFELALADHPGPAHGFLADRFREIRRPVADRGHA